MDEELVLDVDELAVGDPGDDLVEEHLLALLEDGRGPALEPGVAALEGLPKDVDDHSAFELLAHDLLDDAPELLHHYLVFAELGPDVAEGEVSVAQEVALDGQDQGLVLLQGLLQPVGDGFAVDAGVFADVGEGELCLLVSDEGRELFVVEAGLGDLGDHGGLGGGEDGGRGVHCEGLVSAFYYGARLAQKGHQELVQHRIKFELGGILYYVGC